MSPTLLEFVVAGILLVVAWQIGVTIAPWIFQKLRGLKDDLDEAAEQIGPEHTENLGATRSEETTPDNKYRNN